GSSPPGPLLARRGGARCSRGGEGCMTRTETKLISRPFTWRLSQCRILRAIQIHAPMREYSVVCSSDAKLQSARRNGYHLSTVRPLALARDDQAVIGQANHLVGVCGAWGSPAGVSGARVLPAQ